MSMLIILVIVVAIALLREWIAVSTSGWGKLSRNFRSGAPFHGKCRPCWWAQFTNATGKRGMVVNIGRVSRWAIRVEFPPIWIGASTQGLYLKRNIWNLLHPALQIPWGRISSAKEANLKDLLRNTTPAAAMMSSPRQLHPVLAAAQGLSGPMVEVQILDPRISIIAQRTAFEEALPFLQSKMATAKAQGG